MSSASASVPSARANASTKCIRVAVRVRPSLNAGAVASNSTSSTTAASSAAVVTAPPAVTVESDEQGDFVRLRERVGDSFGTQHTTESVFRFDACYAAQSAQADIYASEVRPWLDDCFRGVNTTVFCYGQTGSGKTHTVAGSTSDPGLIPRAVADLLQMRDAQVAADAAAAAAVSGARPMGAPSRPPPCTTVSLSFLEIYQEKCIDLLPVAPNGTLLAASTSSSTLSSSSSSSTFGSTADDAPVDLPLREDANRRVQVVGLAEHRLASIADFQRLFAAGVAQRTCAATKLNAHSSRSHAVLALKVERVCGAGRRYTSKLHLIDLAGSEDNRQTGNAGARMAESGAINCSLFAFGKVIHALNANAAAAFASSSASSAHQQHVPYRDSKLTRLLQDSLGGESHAVMICCVAPEARFAATTASTLHFAQLSRKITNRVQAHVVEERDTAVSDAPHWSERMSRPSMAAGGLGGGGSSGSGSVPSTSAMSMADRKIELERWRAERERSKTNGASSLSSSSTSAASLSCTGKVSAPSASSSIGSTATAITTHSRSNPDLSLKVEQLEASVKALTSALQSSNNQQRQVQQPQKPQPTSTATSTASSTGSSKSSCNISARPSSADASVSFVALTPSTKSEYVKGHLERARAHQRVNDFAAALIEYQKGNHPSSLTRD
jgi:kinesin family protein 22